MLSRLIIELRAVVEDGNPYWLRPPTNMEKRRKSLRGRKPKKPKKSGRWKIARKKTQRKTRLTPVQHAAIQVQQARRDGDVEGAHRWNNAYAKHRLTF